jgi:hypothetical protein
MIRIDFGRLDSDPDPGRQNDPQKREEIYTLKSWMFSFEGLRLNINTL